MCQIVCVVVCIEDVFDVQCSVLVFGVVGYVGIGQYVVWQGIVIGVYYVLVMYVVILFLFCQLVFEVIVGVGGEVVVWDVVQLLVYGGVVLVVVIGYDGCCIGVVCVEVQVIV